MISAVFVNNKKNKTYKETIKDGIKYILIMDLSMYRQYKFCIEIRENHFLELNNVHIPGKNICVAM